MKRDALENVIVDMMEMRLRREVDKAEAPFTRHMACLMLEYYLSGQYLFWMEKGDVVWDIVNPEKIE